MSPTSAIVSLCVSLCAVATAAPAQTAEQWLAKSAELAERAPYQVDYTMVANLEQGGSKISTKMTADLLFASKEKMKIAMDIAIEAAAFGGAMEMSGLVVADGEFIWVEMNNPMMGLQVMKTPVGELERLNAQSGLPGMSGNLDPFQQLETLTRWMDFEVTAKEGDTVTLTGTPTAEFEDQFGATAAALGDRMVLELSTDGAPRSMTLGTAEGAVMTMTFENYEFLSASALAADAFAYTPPEGATVITP